MLEIEKRFKNIKPDAIKKILYENLFSFEGTFLYKLISYKGIVSGQSIRIRNEGVKNTFTIKQKNENNYDDELEIEVNDLKTLDKMLSKLNVSKKYEVHKLRSIYKSPNKDIEVVFDHFPGLNPYIEIEAKNENQLFDTMKLLNLKEEPMFGANEMYRDNYGIIQENPNASLTFETYHDVLVKYINKNLEEFNSIINEQIQFIKLNNYDLKLY
jgi:predicted adenylyl cyclase CyaB